MIASLLITAEQLQQAQTEQPSFRLIDVRPHAEYLQMHIPGAVHFDITLCNKSENTTAGLLPTTEQFNQQTAAAGIGADKPVIAYDDTGGPAAARFAWTLKAFGHPHVAMLNGGFQQWRTLNYSLDNTAIAPEPGTFAGQLCADRIADYQYILKNLGNNNLCILDARTAAEFHGNDLRAKRGGHIPGAIHVDWQQTKNPDNPLQFKSVTALQELFQSHGVYPDKEVICYCQSHQRSAVLCVLLEELGYPNVKGYPGAWSDWGNRSDTPIEQ